MTKPRNNLDEEADRILSELFLDEPTSPKRVDIAVLRLTILSIKKSGGEKE